jgi:hypothetical protein
MTAHGSTAQPPAGALGMAGVEERAGDDWLS